MSDIATAVGSQNTGGGAIDGRPIRFWKVWANPIFRRYVRSRLRPVGLGGGLLITLVVAAFLFFLFRAIGFKGDELPPGDAERLPFIPLLVLQGIILFLLGTGQVAGGMTGEYDEGVIDYQRLAPMTPLAKVVGYLFGLPVREYVMCLATFPFTAIAVVRGGIAMDVVLQLYGVFFSAAILYHLTGLVAGTVVKNKRWAFLISMGMVFVLYTVVPQMAAFGLVYFKYLTLWPVFEECLPAIVPREAGKDLELAQTFLAQPRFFGLSFPESAFTFLSQGVLSITFVAMLWRRWRRPDSHLLGKAWAVGFFAWVQTLILGNVLPLIGPGLAFPSREMARRFRRLGNWDRWQPEPTEALAMVAAYGMVSLAILWILTMVIAPTDERQRRGWRRARKLQRPRLPFGSDEATAFWWVAAMVGMAVVGNWVFARAVIESRWFPGWEVAPETLLGLAMVFGAAGIGFHALIEGQGKRVAGLTALFLGLVPLLVGVVLAVVDEKFAVGALWFAGASPASGPLFLATATLPAVELGADIERAAPRAFWFWQGVGVLVALSLVSKLWGARRSIARSTAVSPGSTRRGDGGSDPTIPG